MRERERVRGEGGGRETDARHAISSPLAPSRRRLNKPTFSRNLHTSMPSSLVGDQHTMMASPANLRISPPCISTVSVNKPARVFFHMHDHAHKYFYWAYRRRQQHRISATNDGIRVIRLFSHAVVFTYGTYQCQCVLILEPSAPPRQFSPLNPPQTVIERKERMKKQDER